VCGGWDVEIEEELGEVGGDGEDELWGGEEGCGGEVEERNGIGEVEERERDDVGEVVGGGEEEVAME
ncbi:hypothetical protein V496_05267, partial [Pseudogymnoascus sp. VKM F-4515 (FW-2607)]